VADAHLPTEAIAAAKGVIDDFCIVVAYDCGFAASLSVWESDAANTVIWADHDFDA
jgi:hypothetical protein